MVIECKSPNRTDPIAEAVNQLRRYSDQRNEVDQREGAERLFHFAQVLVASSFYQSKAGTISSTISHYQTWRDTAPLTTAEVCAELGGKERLDEQELLAAGLLRPAHLLDIVQNFIIFMSLPTGKRVKALCRYQQFRAVRAAISRLERARPAASMARLTSVVALSGTLRAAGRASPWSSWCVVCGPHRNCVASRSCW